MNQNFHRLKKNSLALFNLHYKLCPSIYQPILHSKLAQDFRNYLLLARTRRWLYCKYIHTSHLYKKQSCEEPRGSNFASCMEGHSQLLSFLTTWFPLVGIQDKPQPHTNKAATRYLPRVFPHLLSELVPGRAV